jgi:hypothetical protein
MVRALLLFAFAAPLAASCLTIDTITVMTPPACARGTCQTGPGEITGAKLRAMVVPRFEVTAHNSCRTKQPSIQQLAFRVEVAFYSKDGRRMGISSFFVQTLEPGEKIWHAFEIPDDVRILAPASSVKVKSITEVAFP